MRGSRRSDGEGAGREGGEIELPADPDHRRAEACLVPAHGHAQNLEQNDQDRGCQRGG